MIQHFDSKEKALEKFERTNYTKIGDNIWDSGEVVAKMIEFCNSETVMVLYYVDEDRLKVISSGMCYSS